LIYKYIRIEDDRKHDGVYQPDARHDAERFRSQLFSRLRAIPGEETYCLFRELAKNAPTESSREVFLRSARERAEQDSEFEAWQPEEIDEFAERHEIDPKSSDDLFRIALDRLDDIKNFIEGGDFSLRALFSPETNESEVQKFFAHEFRTRSGNRYSTVREEEVDNLKKPDIRLHNPNVQGPIGIEVKCANKWTYGQLEESLRKLAGEYLRDARSCHGILLLAYLGGRKGWRPAGKKQLLSFRQLVDALDEGARELAKLENAILGLRVLGVDFTS
jgi:hypothetical protein